ncbi:hypothetical protein Franean1_2673 [Parafrankia sp. EAN1pec]|uniref:hypothetical protein n=1 Tax=Parafrankia sp. (strain EAN1pec) TaxID=298653 RepID=UPI000054208C|nr:hypothetical protein Franean1_2673 [Frankia sp. EAN1pec]
MLAILAGKLDPAAGTASARSEDALTDAVFGAIRHLPYRRVLGTVLAAVDVPVDPETLDRAQVLLWPSYQVPQLPGMRVEPDVVVTAGTTVVVFEAKYTSPFSLYPADEPAGGEPLHQLAAQFAALRAVAAARGWPGPGWIPGSGNVAGWFLCSLRIDRPVRHPALPRQHRHDYAADLHRGLPTDTPSRLRSRATHQATRALHPGLYPPG